MNPDLLNKNLFSLERKINLLLNEHKSLKEEIRFLKHENEELRSVVRVKDDQISNFHNKLKITKLADSISHEDDNSTELKRKIDEYIKEIDKCIAHLAK